MNDACDGYRAFCRVVSGIITGHSGMPGRRHRDNIGLMAQLLSGDRWLAPVSVSRVPRRQEGLDLQVFKGFDTDPSLCHQTVEVSDKLDLV